ncbi:MAG: right-handed parallel beta-helix repeat-containing protein [Pseudomonadota bacterium]|nr:right-handed parallel beta-helix repeat-containing protein [Pseudomonadota bacterium]
MKKGTFFAADGGVATLLCCSAALWLSACGGSSSSADTQSAAAASLLAVADHVAANPDTAPTALLATATAVTASTYHLYVATTGADTNAGTQASPFRTITKAASVAKASTTVHVAAGTYNETVKTNNSGTSSARIRYVSDTKWGAKIIGSGSEGMWTNNGDYVDIVGFDISGPGRLGILNYASFSLISGNHVHHLTVSGGCSGNGGAGIDNANYSSSDDDIIGNVVHDIGVPGACNGIQGIYSSNLRGHIYNNTVYRVSAWGIQLWHAANNVMIANNTVFANGSAGMGGGIVFGTGDSPGGVILDNTSVVNNLVYANPGDGIREYCYAGPECIGAHNTVANNLVYANGSAITMRVGGATATISADPQFVNYQANGSGDYHLRSTSPAIDKGIANSAPAYDMDDVARPSGAAYDIGAYELVAAPVVQGLHLYVTSTGSDANGGTQASPFRSITKAASVAKPDTTVHVASGTYYENVSTGASGTATARIRYVADTKWGARIIGSGTEGMWTNNGNYVDIVGFDISGSGRLGIVNNASFALMSGNHVHNLTVSGGCGDGGAGISNANNSGSDDDIIGNVVNDIGVPGACSGVHGIYSSNLRGHIYNNIIYRASSWGIHLWQAANSVAVANNTIFANGSTGMGGGMIFGTGDSGTNVVLDNSTVVNNLVYDNPGPAIKQYCYAGVSCIGTHNTIENNLVFGNGSAITLVVGSATGTIAADPKFVNYQKNGSGNYRLLSTSPAVNKGVTHYAPAYDIDAIARPLGAALDIGAYESF